MAIGQFSCTYTEDYIEMDISSSSDFCYSLNSQPQTGEFEFQMNSVSLERELATSPADELFYMGKLLPLHLPPRIQMVHKLIQNSGIQNPPVTCNLSPTESCRFSFELKPVELEHWSSIEIGGHQKLRQNKQSSFFQKLKASRAYIRYLFSKSACSDESCAKLADNRPKRKESDFKRHHYTSTLIDKDRVRSQRRASFSGTKSSYSSSVSSSGSSSLSSSFSFSSSGLRVPQVLKRCSSANSEMAHSIEGAIAHCKHSQFL